MVRHNPAPRRASYLFCCSLCLRHGELAVELLLSSSSSSSMGCSELLLFKLLCCLSTSSVRSLWSWFYKTNKQTNKMHEEESPTLVLFVKPKLRVSFSHLHVADCIDPASPLGGAVGLEGVRRHGALKFVEVDEDE